MKECHHEFSSKLHEIIFTVKAIYENGLVVQQISELTPVLNLTDVADTGHETAASYW